MSLKIEKLNKSYGSKKVVDDLSFEVLKPACFGLLGTNGAGKTTTIRMILEILKKDSGTIKWKNEEIVGLNSTFGYLPEERGLYPKSKIYDQIMYFANLKGIDKEQADEKIAYWLKRLDVEEYKYMTPDKLSKGNQQKIQFILSVLHDPELIILDEPFSGLDPVNTELLKNVINELVDQNKFIIMSSHQMSSIEEFCSDLLILHKGKTVLKGNLKEIKNSYEAKEVILETNDNIDKLLKDNKYKVLSRNDDEYIVAINKKEDSTKLLNILTKNKINIIKYELKRPTLHDIFVEKVEGVN